MILALAQRQAGILLQSGRELWVPQPHGLGMPAKALATVVLPTALALLLCNMDRICLSVAIIPMSAEFGWAESYQGVIQSAFLWGYMATQLLGGALADKYGSIPAGCVVMLPQPASLPPALGPGTASADKQPGSGKLVLAGGMLWFSLASLLLPLALSPPVVAAATWAIIVVNVINHFGYFIYLNWMPTYFVKALGFDLRSSSFMAFLPWLVMAVGSSLSGLLADSLVAGGVPLVKLSWLPLQQ
ncbi:MFS domain-containing protein [Haematococcus lacustris]|uniref:MFS domain-containing protein n=1 Tax=Haematococcus lacustris TaxID=44745 RepID=A0A6A0A2A2_HAELA|nr:MFS domain-containing protein [Haematococcus lacustris]